MLICMRVKTQTRKSQVDNRLALLLVIIMDNTIDYHPTPQSSGH